MPQRHHENGCCFVRGRTEQSSHNATHFQSAAIYPSLTVSLNYFTYAYLSKFIRLSLLGIFDKVQGVVQTVTDAVNKLVAQLTETVNALVGNVGDILKDLSGQTAATNKKILDKLKEIVQDVINKLDSADIDIPSTVEEIIQKLKDFVSSINVELSPEFYDALTVELENFFAN